MLVLQIAIELVGVAFAANPGGSGCWDVDKTTVIAGGCVTIIVDKPCNESWKLALQVNDDPPISLLQGAGPNFHRRNSRLPGREATLVLFFRDFMDMEAMEEIGPGLFRWLTAFDEPGIVRLTLYDGDASLGTKEVTVLPCPPEAEEALELLNAPLTGTKRPREEHLWIGLMSGSETFSFTPPLTERELEIMRQQLPIVVRHPDWAEIAEMRFAGVEAWHYVRQVTDDKRRLRDDVPVVEFPRIVTECLFKQVQSPFAQAIQDRVRDTAGLVMSQAGERAGPRMREAMPKIRKQFEAMKKQ